MASFNNDKEEKIAVLNLLKYNISKHSIEKDYRQKNNKNLEVKKAKL